MATYLRRALVPLMLLAASAVQHTTATTVAFSRLINTCDAQDQAISSGTTKLVFSSSPQIPTTASSIRQHTVHGTKSVRLTQPAVPTPTLPSDAATIDLVASNLTIPFPSSSPSTSYYCHALSLGVPSKRHVIGWEVSINPPENAAYVHHVLIYICDARTFNVSRVGYKGMCDEFPQDLSACLSKGVLAVWAIGGGQFWLPSKMGMPIGPSPSDATDPLPQYVVMQTHYNNPNQVQGIVDSSGIRLHHTGQLRANEAGVFYQGHVTDSRFVIPARTPSFDVTAYCPQEATEYLLPPVTGINISSVFLHMHLVGKAASLRHFRNHTELAPISQEPYYDFNFQDYDVLAEEVQVLPGDELLTQCTYDTSALATPVQFGEATTNEMCLAFFVYYPRVRGGGVCLFGNYSAFYPGMFPPAGGLLDIGVGQIQDGFAAQVINKAWTEPVCTYATREDLQNRFGAASVSINPAILPLAQFDGSRYSRSLWLDDMNMDSMGSSKMFELFWSVDQSRGVIDFALQVNNSDGWVGFGFSPTGGMANSDMIIAYLSYACASLPAGTNLIDGHPCVNAGNFTGPVLGDRFATANALPPLDTKQDYFNVVFYTDLPVPAGYTPVTGSSTGGSGSGAGTGLPGAASSTVSSSFGLFALLATALVGLVLA